MKILIHCFVGFSNCIAGPWTINVLICLLRFDTSLAKPGQDLSSRWLAAVDSDLSSFTVDDLLNFSALQKREFISLLLQSDTAVSVAKLEAMDSLYKLSTVKNSEIRFRSVICPLDCDDMCRSCIIKGISVTTF